MGSLYLSASPPHHFSTDRHCFFSLLALNLSIWWIAAKSNVDTANVFMALIAMVEVNYFNAFICSWELRDLALKQLSVLILHIRYSIY